MKPPYVKIGTKDETRMFSLDEESISAIRQKLFEYSVTMDPMKLPAGMFVLFKLPYTVKNLIYRFSHDPLNLSILVVISEDWSMSILKRKCRWLYENKPIDL